jgi:RNA polymerase sigma-70 factor, ECF subfamily
MQLRADAKAVSGGEEALIAGALQGRTEAFGELIQPHLPSLSRLASLRLQSDTEAEDAVQQTMLRAYCHLHQFRREATFKTWLCAIAFREVGQLRRSRSAVHLRSLHEAQVATLADPGVSPETQCQQTQQVERLHKALLKLPEKYRSVIQLRDLRELSVAETAQSLSLTTPTVKVRHSRARKLLLKSFKNVSPLGAHNA